MCPGGDRHTRRRRFFLHFYFTGTRLPLINIIILFMNANKRPPAREMQRLRSAETSDSASSVCICSTYTCSSIIIYVHRTQIRVRLCAWNKQTVYRCIVVPLHRDEWWRQSQITAHRPLSLKDISNLPANLLRIKSVFCVCNNNNNKRWKDDDDDVETKSDGDE